MGVWPRRLALVVSPAPGESFASWVDRLAVRNGCPPWMMAESLGLDLRSVSGDVRSLAYGVVATAEMCEAISAATGVDTEVVRDMHLGVFSGSAVDLTGVRVGDKESVCRAEVREWARFFGSRACPQCLTASSGVRQVWWKLGWGAVCPVHHVLLVDQCPRCGVRLRRGSAGRPLGLSRRRAPDPLRCGAVVSGMVCDQLIPRIRTSTVSGDLAGKQQMVLEVTERRRAPLVGGQVVSAGQWFAALKAVAVLVRLGVPEVLPLLKAGSSDGGQALIREVVRHQGNRAGPQGRFGTVPQTAGAAAELLTVALDLVGADGKSELVARLAPLSAVARRRWTGLRSDPLAELSLPSVFAAALSIAW
ncbi:TniQ family protein [Nonomuraea sp. NPDC050383]|uniref:TniQ family protein n=1 Tax=Nonomuraea sp. NPDC050383 TaxID=3364362 RepID=UPI0037A18C61